MSEVKFQNGIKGVVKIIYDEVTFDSGFNKREFVVTTDDKYPQDIKMECVKESVKILEDIRVGNPVNCFINVRGNEFKEKYYVNLTCWKIEQADIIRDDVQKPVTKEILDAADKAQDEAKDDPDSGILPF